MSFNENLGLTDIHVMPFSGKPPRFLQHDNYLGEFKTKVDKARVRANLGIADELNYQWGNISGSIYNQPDLIELINSSLNKCSNTEDIQALYLHISDILVQIDSLKKEIQKLQFLYKDSLTIPNESQNVVSLKLSIENTIEKRKGDPDQYLSIFAIYSDGSHINVTNSSTVYSTDDNVAVWDSNKIKFIGAGECSLVIFFKDLLCEVKINVMDEINYLYVGYANDFSEILGNPDFEFNTVANTWTSQNTPSRKNIELEKRIGFWVCTTENIESFKEIGLFDLDEIHYNTVTYHDKLYNIYVIGVQSNESIFTITVK